MPSEAVKPKRSKKPDPARCGVCYAFMRCGQPQCFVCGQRYSRIAWMWSYVAPVLDSFYRAR